MQISSLFRQLKKSSLLKKIFLSSLVFGVTVSIAIVTFRAYFSYVFVVEQNEICLQVEVEEVIEEISELVWRNESEKVIDLLHTLQSKCQLSLDKMLPLHISLEIDEGAPIKVGPEFYSNRVVSLTYPLSFWKGNEAQAYWLGELRLIQDISQVFEQELEQSLKLLMTYLLITVSVVLLCVYLGYNTITRHVREFMGHFKEQSVKESIEKVSKLEPSEISELWITILEIRQAFEEKSVQSESKLKLCQNELAKEKRNSEMKSHFLAKLSHELRTPMNGLLGFSSLLLESKLEDEQREYAQTIQASLESLLYVVNDVLDLSRIESGDLVVTSIPFNIRGVLSGVSNLLKNRAESKGLQFESRIAPEIPQSLRGDPVRIRQVLMNLVSNAIEHTAKGYVLLNAELTQTQNGRATLRLSIEDTGDQNRVKKSEEEAGIDAGFSSELRDKRSLGLDICYQLVGLMGSELRSELKSESGSTFWFEISLPVIKQSNTSESLDFNLVKALKVLVIDSYELSRKITLELLSEWGIQFEAVSTAADALKLLQQNSFSEDPFNMVLCDDLLQDLSGIEACQMIKQVVGDKIQIVVLCSNPQLGDAENFFLSGANGFLSKQFRDPFLRGVMCQSYAERNRQGREKRLVTRYTVSDVEEHKIVDNVVKGSMRKGYVLMVEDNIVNQQLVMRMLERNGCEVDLAANGFEGIELFKKNKYDLIFMDCLMPEMDGYETTQIIREIERSNTERARTPIVALTAHAFEEVADRCFQVGMDEFMTKPFKIAQLEMVLERYIN